MSRQIWTAVLATVGLLLVASALEAPERWRRAGRAVASGAAAAAGDGAAFAAAHRRELLYTGAGALVATLAGFGLARRRSTRRAAHGVPWREVVELARRGRSVETIARSTHLAQDAVRTVLQPVAPDPEFTPGKSFRHEPPGSPVRGPGRRPGSGR